MFWVWEESRFGSDQSVASVNFGFSSTGVLTCFSLPPVLSRNLVGFSAVLDAVALHQIPALVWQFRRDRYSRDVRLPSLSPNLTDTIKRSRQFPVTPSTSLKPVYQPQPR